MAVRRSSNSALSTGKEADLARAEDVDVLHLRAEDADLVDLVDRAVGHEGDAVVLAHLAVDDAHKDDHAEVAVIPTVNQHRLERCGDVAFGRRKLVDDRLERGDDAFAGFGGHADGVGGVKADDVLDLQCDGVTVGCWQVDFVQDRHDFVVSLNRVIDVGERLRLDPLGAVDDQQRAFDGAFDAHGVGFDGDAALAFDIHTIEHLRLHITCGHGVCLLDQTVGQRGFPVVDMRHDREITDMR